MIDLVTDKPHSLRQVLVTIMPLVFCSYYFPSSALNDVGFYTQPGCEGEGWKRALRCVATVVRFTRQTRIVYFNRTTLTYFTHWSGVRVKGQALYCVNALVLFTRWKRIVYFSFSRATSAYFTCGNTVEVGEIQLLIL